MAITDFESELNLGPITTGTLRGGTTGVTVEEDDGTGVFSPTQVIRTDRDWAITVNWQLVGTMLDSPFFTIPGNWVVKAYLEGWGQNAEEKDLDSDNVTVPVVPPTTRVPGVPGVSDPEWQYEETFTILRANNPRPGPYRLAITITYEDAAGNPGPMAGFLEVGDMVQLYKPGP